MIVLDETFTFAPDDSKTNHSVPFYLPRDYHALRFECRYSPKVIEDKELALQVVRASIGRYVPRYQLPLYAKQLEQGENLVNLLTLSIDCGDEYLGCAHRHAARQTHTISKAGSSPGFIRHAAAAGHWRAVINIHSITSPELQYHLTVTALEEETA